jgi:hypothetical protein
MRTYVNLSLDTIYLDDPAPMIEGPHNPYGCSQIWCFLRSVTKLALGLKWDNCWEHGTPSIWIDMVVLKLCGNLKELCVAAFTSTGRLAHGISEPLEVQHELVLQLEKLALQTRERTNLARLSLGADEKVGIQLVADATYRAWAKEENDEWTEIR